MTGFAFRLLPFFAAFLLFSIQPMTGKITLPMIGSAPQGWLVTLAFFQTTLVAGYALVYASRKLSARASGILFAALLAGGYMFYTRDAQFTMANDGSAAFDLFAWLWQSYGFPITALSAMAPLTQRLFAATYPDNPYRLYAISNAGSFLGLLSYPLVFERLTDLPVQVQGWLYLYAALIPLLLACALAAKQDDAAQDAAPRIATRTYGLWLVLAALPASMLSGVTSFITSDIMSLPLLWALPLALYLGTYIAAFSGHVSRHLPTLTFGFGIAATLLIALSVLGGLASLPWASIILIATFTLGAYLCHLRLYEARPHAASLPLFYTVIALGGALGGLFNAFLAPLVFPYTHEFFFALALVLVLIPPFAGTSPGLERAARILAGVCIVCAVLAPHLPPGAVKILGIVIFFTLAMLSTAPRLLLLAFAVCLVFNTTRAMAPWPEIAHARNFFGTLRVQDVANDSARVLIHGTVLHGMQSRDPSVQHTPIYYFGRQGPASQAIEAGGKGPVAIVGLGVGQLAAYRTPSRSITYYEIDPDVITYAREYFTYLHDNKVDDIVLGDGRLALAASGQTYKGIILDAFSSDAIPAHLLTREAIAMYAQHLTRDGYILFHISNRYLDLAPLLAAQAQALGWTGLGILYTPPKDQPLMMKSRWFVMTPNMRTAAALRKHGWAEFEPSSVLWRDDRFSVLDAIF